MIVYFILPTVLVGYESDKAVLIWDESLSLKQYQKPAFSSVLFGVAQIFLGENRQHLGFTTFESLISGKFDHNLVINVREKRKLAKEDETEALTMFWNYPELDFLKSKIG